MKEQLLHFIWQHQYFDGSGLQTSAGEKIQVLHPGSYNTNSGPDFLEARILIDGIRWRGSVEIHVKASEWNAHGHQYDPAYNNVVLHVVWHKEIPVFRKEGSMIPVVSLIDRTPTSILRKYNQLVNGFMHIPCATQLETANQNSLRSALDRSLYERLKIKSKEIIRSWQQNNRDWESTTFQWLARHYGFRINNENFCTLAQSIPLNILRRHRDRPLQVEALLFGMAGFPGNRKKPDLYQDRLQKEFLFLKYKYGLNPRLKDFHWKHLRLRPGNFPAVRIAQLAAFIQQSASLKDFMLKGSRKEVMGAFQSEVSEYWQQHYSFGKQRESVAGLMGKSSAELLYLNTVLPLKMAAGLLSGNQIPENSIYETLFSIPAENNKITRLWRDQTGVEMTTALDSYSYLSLYQTCCKLRKCLQCPVGLDLMKSA